MIEIRMLPARHGDALLVTYGGGAEQVRLLVDAGPTDAYAGLIARTVAAQPALDLVVVTHYDLDHIGGVIELYKRPPAAAARAAVWFNGRQQLRKYLGPKEGDALSKLLAEANVVWNPPAQFAQGAVAVPKAGALPVISLPGGARATLLSPRREQVQSLLDAWTSASKPPKEKKGPRRLLVKRPPPGEIAPAKVPKLAEGRSTDDTSVANGSSIAFILEHRGSKVLLAGDAHPGVLKASLQKLGGGEPVAVDAVKLPHHGSRANVTTDWLALVSAKEYLVSTNGDQFGHPDPEAIARVVMQPGHKVLRFNYATDYTRPWSRAALQEKFDYEAYLGGDDGGTARVGR